MKQTGKILKLLTLLAFVFLAPVLENESAPVVFSQDKPYKPVLTLTDNLAADSHELALETAEWKVAFSLHYNGGIYQLYDKVTDPGLTDNLLTDNGYCQGGLFDYDVYLSGFQEYMTTMGRHGLGRATLEVLEKTPVRARLRQTCHPRLNNGNGPRNNPFVEIDTVKAVTEWTFYATGRVNIKFDAFTPPEFKEAVSQGPGGAGKGIKTDGNFVIALNGLNFDSPWVASGDKISSPSGGWGPYQVTNHLNAEKLRVSMKLPPGENLDFIITRPNIEMETISIHVDGSQDKPRQRVWQGGSNGVPVFPMSKSEDKRGDNPSLSGDYLFAIWSLPPRTFGSLLAFNEPYPNANFAVVNDQTYSNIAYIQVGEASGQRPFAEHHRHFLVQLGTDNAKGLPPIKGIPDALPFADDYRNPYAVARVGALKTGAGISRFGFHLPTGAYHIAAKNKVAALAFDASRGGSVPQPVAYRSPAVLVFGLDAPDNRLAVELSQDNGKKFAPLAASDYLITTRAQAAQLGGKDRRLFQLLSAVPATALGQAAWVVRLRQK